MTRSREFVTRDSCNLSKLSFSVFPSIFLFSPFYFPFPFCLFVCLLVYSFVYFLPYFSFNYTWYLQSIDIYSCNNQRYNFEQLFESHVASQLDTMFVDDIAMFILVLFFLFRFDSVYSDCDSA